MEKFSQSQGSIKTWASDDRPREKMLLKGASSLSNSELLAILINNGSKTRSALDLAKEILLLGANNLNELDSNDTSIGRHATLLANVSCAIAAFRR